MTFPILDNRTDLELEPLVLLEPDGERLVAIAKGTYFLLGGALEAAPPQERRPIRHVHENWGDPATTPPKYPSDAFVTKIGTDVIVVACGHAPEGKPVPSFEVAVSVGSLAKRLTVHGLRVWTGGGGISAAQPTTDEEIRYDLAWGGLDFNRDGDIVEEPRNPTGRGVVLDAGALVHQRAPSIEDPDAPIRSVDSSNVPAGFGPLGPQWEPRRAFYGTYDDAWQENQSPLPPADRDPRANICASPGLHAEPPLGGHEIVSLQNLSPAGALQFLLPRTHLEMTFTHRGERILGMVPQLDTVILDTLHVTRDTPVVVELVWRAAIPVPRRLQDLTIELQLAR